MTYQAIGLGTTVGDGTGDSIRDGGDKINDNFVEIYTLLGTGTTLSSGISATASVVTLAGPSISGVASFADGSVSAPSITNTGDANTGIYFGAADTVNVTTGGTKRVDIDSSGLDVTGNVTATGNITAGGSIDFGDGHSIGDDGNDNLAITSGTAENIILGPAGGVVNLADDKKITFGSGQDLEIYHDASDSVIKDSGVGRLYIAASTLQFTNAAIDETSATFTTAGAVTLYHNNAVKLATSAAGGTLTGVWVTSANITNGTIVSADIAADTIAESNMANDSVGSAEMKTLSTLLIKNSSGSTLKTMHAAGA